MRGNVFAAVLHDVVKDGGMTINDLRKAGYSGEVITAIDYLTRRDGEDYDILETDDTDNITKIVEPDGSQEEIYSQGIADGNYVDPVDVDLYFNQFKEERRE